MQAAGFGSPLLLAIRAEYTTPMAALAEHVKVDPTLKVSDGYTPQTWNYLRLPLTLQLASPFTDEEFIRFSRAYRPYQMELNASGGLEIMSPSGVDGGWREMFAGRKLSDWADEHGGVCFGATAGFRLADNSVRSPDAAWVPKAWVDGLSEAQRETYAPFCPEFVIEILSKWDSRRELERKMAMWIEAGARLAWMIDPFKADLAIYRIDREPEWMERPDWVEADAVVTGFRLETRKLWAE